jgi:hypothetical protein
MNYPIYILGDEHRLDGEPDDFFSRMTVMGRVCDVYESYRHTHPGTWIHLGDTFDTLRADAERIKDAWGYLAKIEQDDIFILGNHEVSLERLRTIAPGECVEHLDINGYDIEHGHRLFHVSTQEWLLLGQLLYLNRKTNRRWKCLERKIEQISGAHRDNTAAYEAFKKDNITNAIFGHTHVKGNQGGYWNPGAFWRDLTVVVFDNPEAGPRFEILL